MKGPSVTASHRRWIGIASLALALAATIGAISWSATERPELPDMAKVQGTGGSFRGIELPALKPEPVSAVRTGEVLGWPGHALADAVRQLGQPDLSLPTAEFPGATACFWFSSIGSEGRSGEPWPTAHVRVVVSKQAGSGARILQAAIIGSAANLLASEPTNIPPLDQGSGP